MSSFNSKLLTFNFDSSSVSFEIEFEDFDNNLTFVFVGKLPTKPNHMVKWDSIPRSWHSALGNAKLQSLKARLDFAYCGIKA